MNRTRKWYSIQNLAIIGLMSALVFVFSNISIPIVGSTRIHFGNIMCLLSGVLFGPLVGGLASGMGSMIFDLTNPKYAPEFWITFMTKFFIGFMAGIVYKYAFKKLSNTLRIVFSCLSGSILYIILYITKNAIQYYFVNGVAGTALIIAIIPEIITSIINGGIAVIACVFLARLLQPALSKANILFLKPLKKQNQ